MSGIKLHERTDVIKGPDIVEASESKIEDLDRILLDGNDNTKKAYIGHNLSEPDMPGIRKDIATHKLNVDPLYPLVQQIRRKFNAAINDVVSKEVDKLLANGSIRESKYPQWVANVVMVKKKNGKWRMCVDLIDLNKACPKDSFPLPNIDQLIDAIAGHELQSFLDAYSSYNQILMEEEYQEKTTFITHQGTYCYKVQKLTGRIAALSRFISRSSDRCHKFFSVLKKDNGLQWNSECVDALRKLKTYLSSPPQLAKAEPGECLLVYLAVSEVAVSAVLVCESKGTQSPIYYINKTLVDAEMSAEILSEVKQEALRASPGRHDLWVLYTDGASNASGSGLGLVLKVPMGEVIHHSIRCPEMTNNEAEYEAVIAGLKLALKYGARRVVLHCDSQILVNQVTGTFQIKEQRLQKYQTEIHKMLPKFDDCRFDQIPRAQNIKADDLAKLAAATKNITKENVVTPLHSSIDQVEEVIAFIWKNIIYRFGIPKEISCDNGPQFTVKKTTEFFVKWHIKRILFITYHPVENGQVESSNKTILNILKKKLEDAKGLWPELLQEVLWAYRTTPKTSTGETPYSLVYGTDAVIPVEVGEPSLRYSNESGPEE
ncbi:PREDICTED: uncharacterized protein LOC109225958 [Nicotiana attenuata]|uniref:uncharacterized protein LOC109225958 n=1 Tax=Nicotiana attenuata TaxID=49451 RepID=UPI00090476A4|nr:PREDICTED: uncharacterized protein LOC109225958 [Nicotiana attenuata]